MQQAEHAALSPECGHRMASGMRVSGLMDRSGVHLEDSWPRAIGMQEGHVV